MNVPVWLMIVSLSLLTFLLRGAFLVFGSNLTLPASFDRIFRYIPAAILAAFVGPAFVKNDGVLDYSLTNPYLLAGLVAIVIAARTKSILITLVIGMISLWAFRWLIVATS